MDETPVARFYRDAKILELGVGTSEIQRLVISRALGLPVTCWRSSDGAALGARAGGGGRAGAREAAAAAAPVGTGVGPAAQLLARARDARLGGRAQIGSAHVW